MYKYMNFGWVRESAQASADARNQAIRLVAQRNQFYLFPSALILASDPKPKEILLLIPIMMK